jgi:Gpi18-like mannosyltransferase
MTFKSKVNYFLLQKATWFAIIVLGIILKFILAPVKTGDYIVFLEPWLLFIKAHGYFSSLKYGFYDYSPAYIYILVILAKIGLNPLFSVKLVSIIFEYLAAFIIGKIAYQKHKNNLVIWIAFAVIPVLPTVMLNSSYLSQCDSIYAALVLLSIFFTFKKNQILSILFLSIAFAFKMQTAIILPFFYVLMLRGKINWYYFLLIPLVFVISLIPACVFGRSFSDLLSIYISQTDHYRFLTLNFPNLYIWISNDYYESVKIIGILVTALTTLLSGYFLSRIKKEFTFEIWVKLAFLSAIVVPFILPGMHERYMYLGDVLGVLYFLVVRKNIHLPVGILLVSFYSYIRCSRYNGVIPMEPAFVVYLTVIVLTIFDFIKSLKNDSKPVEQ